MAAETESRHSLTQMDVDRPEAQRPSKPERRSLSGGTDLKQLVHAGEYTKELYEPPCASCAFQATVKVSR